MNLRKPIVAAAVALSSWSASAQSSMPLPVTPIVPAVVASGRGADSASTTDSEGSAREGSSTATVLLIATRPAGVTSRDALRAPLAPTLEITDTVPRRRAVAYSDWYSRRLTIHRYGSYAMLPLFATQYVLGNKLLNQKVALYANERTIPIDKGLRSTHAVVAGAVGTLFIVNTTTGLWNLIESRHTEAGRTRRTVHALTMLAADAGFAYTGVLGSRATDRGPPQARAHRNTALTSFGISTAGAALMWFGNRD